MKPAELFELVHKSGVEVADLQIQYGSRLFFRMKPAGGEEVMVWMKDEVFSAKVKKSGSAEKVLDTEQLRTWLTALVSARSALA